MHELTTSCRACGSSRRLEILSLGEMPLADGLVSPNRLLEREPRFPLTVLFCEDCTLVQIRETVAPEVLYCRDYPYYSSVSAAWVEHCRQNALELIETRGLGADSLVLEIACNDGYMLKNFLQQGIPTLGIDPADPVSEAERLGIPVIRDFFTQKLAAGLQGDGRQADVILANNVLAHVADLPGLVSGIHTVLKDDGVAVIEVPYLRAMIERCEFDTIYHEHHCYFSVTALSRLFGFHGLSLNDVRRLSTHGGSLRLYVEKQAAVSDSVVRLLDEEHELGMDGIQYYSDFAQRVDSVKSALRDLLQDLKRSGCRIAAYAAAAKGATLLNAAGIDGELLDYVVDRNEHKHGKFMPGVHLPIVDTNRLLHDRPDYVLLLAWNLKEEILAQQSEYRRQGGQFILPLPEPQILSAASEPPSHEKR